MNQCILHTVLLLNNESVYTKLEYGDSNGSSDIFKALVMNPFLCTAMCIILWKKLKEFKTVVLIFGNIKRFEKTK